MGVKEIKVGILSIAGLVVAYFGFNYLKGNSLLNEGTVLYSVYDDVEGLHVGSKVVLNGFPIGRVRKITFASGGDGKLLVEYVVVNESIQITKNTVAQILSTDIFGSKAINLLIQSSDQYVASGDTLVSQEAVSMMAEVENRFEPLKVKYDSTMTAVKDLLTNVNQTFVTVNSMLENERKNIHAITSNAASITQNLEDNNAHISNSLKNMSALSDSLSQADIKKMLENANLALLQMKEAMEKVNNGTGTMSKMLNDSSLYTNLNQSAIDLDLLLKDMKEHPKRYVHFSIWGGKDKEEKNESDN
ncbi:MCE family protein [bacterium SCSIO 12643]|nr:MCE family protein [bacterium SCSIO 12643]